MSPKEELQPQPHQERKTRLSFEVHPSLLLRDVLEVPPVRDDDDADDDELSVLLGNEDDYLLQDYTDSSLLSLLDDDDDGDALEEMLHGCSSGLDDVDDDMGEKERILLDFMLSWH